MAISERTQDDGLRVLHFTVADLSKRFSAHPVTVRRWVREQRLHPLRLGRLIRFTAEEVARFERAGGAL